MRLWRYVFTGLCLATLLMVASSKALAVPVITTIYENGNGTLVFSPGSATPLTAGMRSAPAPDGLLLLASARTYNPQVPPGLAVGSALPLDLTGGSISDIIRFNHTVTGGGGITYPTSRVFYSANLTGDTYLADTGFPTGFYPNIFTVVEMNGSATHSPMANQPGSVSMYAMTYALYNDVRPVPEPIIMLLLGIGLAGIVRAVRRWRKAQA
jgi:hypothetical protein